MLILILMMKMVIMLMKMVMYILMAKMVIMLTKMVMVTMMNVDDRTQPLSKKHLNILKAVQGKMCVINCFMKRKTTSQTLFRPDIHLGRLGFPSLSKLNR